MRPHRRQPTRLPHPWESPGQNTGVGCHFLFQCMKVKTESEVAQSCPTLSDPTPAAFQAPLSMGFSRQECWSGVPLPSPTEQNSSQLQRFWVTLLTAEWGDDTPRGLVSSPQTHCRAGQPWKPCCSSLRALDVTVGPTVPSDGIVRPCDPSLSGPQPSCYCFSKASIFFPSFA